MTEVKKNSSGGFKIYTFQNSGCMCSEYKMWKINFDYISEARGAKITVCEKE